VGSGLESGGGLGDVARGWWMGWLGEGGEGGEDWKRFCFHVTDDVIMISSSPPTSTPPPHTQVNSIGSQLLGCLLGEWGLQAELRALAGTFLLASPAVAAWADDLLDCVEGAGGVEGLDAAELTIGLQVGGVGWGGVGWMGWVGFRSLWEERLCRQPRWTNQSINQAKQASRTNPIKTLPTNRHPRARHARSLPQRPPKTTPCQCQAAWWSLWTHPCLTRSAHQQREAAAQPPLPLPLLQDSTHPAAAAAVESGVGVSAKGRLYRS